MRAVGLFIQPYGLFLCWTWSGIGTVIYRGKTVDHPVIVTDEGSLRSLRFGTEERQSCLDLAAPHVLQLAYTRWMTTALLLPPQPQNLLVIGLGGAALPHFLLHLFPEASLTIVEKERLVIDIAHGYFRLPLSPRVRICHQDALAFCGIYAQRRLSRGLSRYFRGRCHGAGPV